MSSTSDHALRVLITGATGNIGSHLQSQLLQQGLEPVAMISSPEKKSLLHHNEGGPIDFVCANYNDETAMKAALSKVDALFMLIPFDEAMLTWGQRLVDLSIDAGIKQIVKISAWQADIDSESKMAALHGEIDQAVKNSGIPFTILSCNSFMENFTHLYGGLIRSKNFFATDEGDASMGFIACEDIAGVAAHCFDDSKHKNATYYLTGQELLTHQSIAQMLSQQLGRTIQYLSLPSEQMSAGYKKLGVSDWKIQVLNSLSKFLAAGHAGITNDTVESITGRKPKLMADFISENLAKWQN